MQNPATKVFSDAARASALAVRRGGQATGSSQQPGSAGVQMGGMTVSPAIAARVKQILAEKAGKGKKKTGGKSKKGPDPAKAREKAARAAKQAAAKQEREKAKLARDVQRTATQAAHETTRKQKATERVAAQAKKQQAQQAKLKQAAQAKKEKAKAAKEKAKAAATSKQEHAKATQAKQAARTQAAKERLVAQAKKQSEAQAKQKQAAADRTAKQTQAQQHKTRVLSEKIKRGGKLSASDTVDAQDAGLIKAGKAMIDLAIKAGARHSSADMQHIQAAHDHSVMAGAQCDPGDDTAPDDEAATKAIKGIMDDPGYFAQHECGDVMQACSGLQTLAMLIQSELSEDDPDPADINQLTDAARILVKFIESELDEMESAAEEDVKEDANEPVPMAKAVGDDFFAVKSIGDSDDVSGPAVRFGSSDEPDLSETHDFFTKSTNYWLDSWDKRPMLWHHTMPQVEILQTMRAAGAAPDEIKAMREAIVYLEDNPVIGVWTKATIDPVAVWMNGQLDRAHRYRSAIKRMIDLGMLKISTDSAPHLVRRERQINGTHEVKRWPIVAASLTPSAAEPRLFDVKAIQSWYDVAGITLPFAIDEEPEAINPESARRDGVKADDERARRILLELDILQLEETAR